jgi:2-polyprenyl-6-methoxyphenol hydroxylase-like FAD-dependent oxidoreductase
VELLLKTNVTAVDQDSDKVSVTTRPSRFNWRQTAGKEWVLEFDEEGGDDSLEEIITAKYVVACDGAPSPIRELLNPGYQFG